MYLLVLSVILNLFLVPLYGLEGAFISFLLTNILLNLVYFYYGFREINFIKIKGSYLIFILFVYSGWLIFISKDDFSYFCISILLNLLILFFAQKKLNRKNASD